MAVVVTVLAVLLAVAVVVTFILGFRTRFARATKPVAPQTPSSTAPSEHRDLVAGSETVELDVVMADSAAALYIPIVSGKTYLALAHPERRTEGRASSVPSQLVGAAVAGQAGLEALVKAGQLTGRLVVVDPATAKAIQAGAMVTDKAGAMLGVIRGSSGKWSGLTRIKPLSGGLVKSAAAGPAMLSAIAMQAQLARVERSIGEVRDSVNAIKGYLDAAEEASVEGRRDTLARVYRTALETGQMTQSLWDQIQDLEAPLRRDVMLADRFLAEAVSELEQGASGFVGPRLKWLDQAGEPVASAVAGVADARRSLLQFSILRLWWLAAVGDPTLASRQSQLRELLAEIPDHAGERARTEKVLAAAGDLKTHHRVLAPRKHKLVASGVEQAQFRIRSLPWSIVDVRRMAELDSG
ncbi:MAG TPA: hypothetical protein VHD58_04390 [Mycobacteriales bacterium]|nr:hypothetical protein [Mycobacteriales bacterium]